MHLIIVRLQQREEEHTIYRNACKGIDWKTEAPIASNEDSKGVRRHFKLESESSILGRAGSMAGRQGSMIKPERACPTKAGLG